MANQELNWDDPIPFGKYEGYPVGEVAEWDPSHLAWMMNEINLRFAQEVVDYVEEVLSHAS